MSATRDTPNGISLFLARPIKVNNVSCLECHTTAEKAPVEMIKLYGTANGFGWKLDDIIGAQIVSVPLAFPLQIAQGAFLNLLWWFVGAFLVILIVANVMVFVLARAKRG
jgi:protein-histidine pros-kinase